MTNKTSFAKASVPAPAFLHSGGSMRPAVKWAHKATHDCRPILKLASSHGRQDANKYRSLGVLSVVGK
jgi:hypothetical protein